MSNCFAGLEQSGHQVRADDVAIGGFDNIRIWEILDPPLTTVSQPAFEIGRETVRSLIMIFRGELAERVSIMLSHTLMIRESMTGR